VGRRGGARRPARDGRRLRRRLLPCRGDPVGGFALTRLTFVGTSDAFGAGGRRQAALFLDTPAGGLLLDCAPTTGSGLAALGIPRDAIDAVAISHFHADHFAGIPQLVLAAVYEDARRRPLVIAGPPDVEARVRRAAEAMGHPLVKHERAFPLRFVELHPGAPVDLGPARVSAFPTQHDPESLPHGLTVEGGGRRIVYSGDTGWFDGLPGHARGADLFVCECTFYDHPFDQHLSYRTIVERAPRFACERLVLTHLGSSMTGRRGQLEIETADDGLSLAP
jgi:ribonuclease BN (tRNA processing enzyme)